jgi:tRNA A-37 threonylcarbamoyl transferase component Bud32
MVTEASEMKYEAHALRVAGALMPHYFPRLVDDSDASQGLIVMEELLPGSASLKDYLENRPLSASRLMRLSGAIGKFHRLFDEIPHEGFRGDDYFRGLLEYRFGLVDSLPISALVDDLMEDTVGRGIILGGLSPKNIQIDGQQIGLLDLETACVGNRYFDVGFNLGHLVLHAIGLGEEISKLINVYRYGYERANYRLPFENKLLARTVLGSMVYRVSHPEAAYIPTGFDEGRVNSLLNRVAKILDDEDLNMQAIVEALKDV